MRVLKRQNYFIYYNNNNNDDIYKNQEIYYHGISLTIKNDI